MVNIWIWVSQPLWTQIPSSLGSIQTWLPMTRFPSTPLHAPDHRPPFLMNFTCVDFVFPNHIVYLSSCFFWLSGFDGLSNVYSCLFVGFCLCVGYTCLPRVRPALELFIFYLPVKFIYSIFLNINTVILTTVTMTSQLQRMLYCAHLYHMKVKYSHSRNFFVKFGWIPVHSYSLSQMPCEPSWQVFLKMLYSYIYLYSSISSEQRVRISEKVRYILVFCNLI